MTWSATSRTEGWLAEILRLQIVHRNEYDLINKVPGLLVAYERHKVFEGLPATAPRSVLPLRKSNTRTDRFAKMVDPDGGTTLPTFIRRMLSAEEEIYKVRAIDHYPEKPTVMTASDGASTFRGAASTSAICASPSIG